MADGVIVINQVIPYSYVLEFSLVRTAYKDWHADKILRFALNDSFFWDLSRLSSHCDSGHFVQNVSG